MGLSCQFQKRVTSSSSAEFERPRTASANTPPDGNATIEVRLWVRAVETVAGQPLVPPLLAGGRLRRWGRLRVCAVGLGVHAEDEVVADESDGGRVDLLHHASTLEVVVGKEQGESAVSIPAQIAWL